MITTKPAGERDDELRKIIRPLRAPCYEVDSQWGYFFEWIQEFGNSYGGLELNPDFQRGHVWTPDQQQRFVENALRGTISSSGFLIQFNCPNFDNNAYSGDLPPGFQCIDGLQRITAVRKYLDGHVRPFGLSVMDLNDTAFSPKRSSYRFNVAIHNFESRSDLLQNYLDLNTGGTVHSLSEINRVTRLLEEARWQADQPLPCQPC